MQGATNESEMDSLPAQDEMQRKEEEIARLKEDHALEVQSLQAQISQLTQQLPLSAQPVQKQPSLSLDELDEVQHTIKVNSGTMPQSLLHLSRCNCHVFLALL